MDKGNQTDFDDVAESHEEPVSPRRSLLLTTDEMSLFVLLEESSSMKACKGWLVNRLSDYETNHLLYERARMLVSSFTSDRHRECYRCSLYPEGALGVYLGKFELLMLMAQIWGWRGIEVHASAGDNFVGRSACIRCCIAMGISQNPVVTMRSSLKWDENLLDPDKADESSSNDQTSTLKRSGRPMI